MERPFLRKVFRDQGEKTQKLIKRIIFYEINICTETLEGNKLFILNRLPRVHLMSNYKYWKYYLIK